MNIRNEDIFVKKIPKKSFYTLRHDEEYKRQK